METNYYFDDKDIYDALLSSKKQISELFLKDCLVDRGIFLSYKETRESLCDYFATWCNDYSTLQEIKAKLEVGQRRPRFESEEIIADGVSISSDAVNASLLQLKTAIAPEGMSLQMSRNGNDFDCTLNYTDVDLSKTPLRQKKCREDKIKVRIEDNGKVSVRTPCGDRFGALRAKFMEELQTQVASGLETQGIHLYEDATVEERIKFFMDIITGMPDFTCETVTGIDVLSSQAEQDDDGNDIETDEQVTSDFRGLLKANLRGGQLFDTPEFNNMKEQGFFPYEIRWWAKQSFTKHLIEYSIGFSNAKAGTGFRCDAMAIKKWSESKHENRKSKESLQGADNDYYMRLLESTVRRVCTEHLQNCTEAHQTTEEPITHLPVETP